MWRILWFLSLQVSGLRTTPITWTDKHARVLEVEFSSNPPPTQLNKTLNHNRVTNGSKLKVCTAEADRIVKMWSNFFYCTDTFPTSYIACGCKTCPAPIKPLVMCNNKKDLPILAIMIAPISTVPSIGPEVDQSYLKDATTMYIVRILLKMGQKHFLARGPINEPHYRLHVLRYDLKAEMCIIYTCNLTVEFIRGLRDSKNACKIDKIAIELTRVPIDDVYATLDTLLEVPLGSTRPSWCGEG